MSAFLKRALRPVVAAVLAAGALAATASAAPGYRTALTLRQPASAAGLRPLETGPAIGPRSLSPADMTATFLDPAFDNDALLAPDLRTFTVTHRLADDHLLMSTVLDTNTLVDGNFVWWFLNTDGNAATGDPTFGGADRYIVVVGQIGQEQIGSYAWDGTAFVFSPLASLTGRSTGFDTLQWEVSLADLGIARGQAVSFMAASEYSGIFANYFDIAPDVGLAPYGFTTENPPPPPPPAPAPAPAPVSPVVTSTGTPSATPVARPLAFRSFTSRRLGNAVRMSISWTGGEGPVFWTVTLDQGPRSKTVTGHSAPGARTVTRTVRLPRTWTGARIRVNALIQDDVSDHERSRTLRALRR